MGSRSRQQDGSSQRWMFEASSQPTVTTTCSGRCLQGRSVSRQAAWMEVDDKGCSGGEVEEGRKSTATSPTLDKRLTSKKLGQMLGPANVACFSTKRRRTSGVHAWTSSRNPAQSLKCSPTKIIGARFSVALHRLCDADGTARWKGGSRR